MVASLLQERKGATRGFGRRGRIRWEGTQSRQDQAPFDLGAPSPGPSFREKGGLKALTKGIRVRHQTYF